MKANPSRLLEGRTSSDQKVGPESENPAPTSNTRLMDVLVVSTSENALLMRSKNARSPTRLPFVLSFCFQETLVRNHAVHFVGQLVLEARDGLAGAAGDEVGGGALHLVQAHVAGFGNLTLGKVHKLGVASVDAETL